jgi:hypothetical protein
MKYAKWKLTWQGEPSSGYGPDPIIVERGDSVEGAFFEGDGDPHNFIYGYLNDNFNFDGLEAWQITEITQAEILEKAQELNPKCYIEENGRIASPPLI